MGTTKGAKPAGRARARKTPEAVSDAPKSDGVAMVALPSKGPGRKRYVPSNSLEALQAQLAQEVAVELMEKIRALTDRMVRASLASIKIKL